MSTPTLSTVKKVYYSSFLNILLGSFQSAWKVKRHSRCLRDNMVKRSPSNLKNAKQSPFVLLDWVGQTLCTCYFWRFFSLNEINYTKGHQADAQSNPVDRSHVTCIPEWKSSWVSMVRHWITSAPLAASKTAFLVNWNERNNAQDQMLLTNLH